ncbi:glycosyl transferase [bacterium DOLZORAL124_38_8]|nr:MAG: glycosyl transferase [bacterium DOLZORAL124_38_8]
MSILQEMKIALVFDWLDDKGGMERVNLALAEEFPDAPIFTSVFDETKFPSLKNRVRTSFLQKLPKFVRPKHQMLAPFMPWAFQSFDLSAFDVVISSASSGFAKSVKKRASAKHICYCHTPIRYLYNARAEYEQNYPLPAWMRPFKFLMPKLLDWLTKVDQNSAKQVDVFVANSNFVAQRIKKYYQQDAKVIYPGIETALFSSQEWQKQDYYLAVGRFIPYKRFDLLVETFAQNGLPLKLAGNGPEKARCQEIVKKYNAHNIEFLGFVEESDLPALYGQAKAFLFPAEEDFGLTPIEAMASGTPVIFYNAGGATETAGPVGVPFDTQTVSSLQTAVETFERNIADFGAKKMQQQAEKFSETRFKQEIWELVEEVCV